MSFIDVTLIACPKNQRLKTLRIFYNDPKASVRSVVRSAIRKAILVDSSSAPDGSAGPAAVPSHGSSGGRSNTQMSSPTTFIGRRPGREDDSERPRSCSSPSPQQPYCEGAAASLVTQVEKKSGACSVVRVSLIPSAAASSSSSRKNDATRCAAQVLLDDRLCEIAVAGEELLVDVEGWAIDHAVATSVHYVIPAEEVSEMVRQLKRRRLEALKQNS